MPRSHWSTIFAAIGLALATAAYAQSVDDDAGSEVRTEEAQGPPVENAEPPQRATIHDLIERIATALDSQDDEVEAQRQRDQAARDLTAQEDMAKWAMYMLWATGAGVLVTFAGVVLVYFTLKHTAAAADYARQAVTHGESAADASWRAVSEAQSATTAARRGARITQEIGERQLRAYVNVIDAKITWGNGRTIAVDVTIKNGGQTPAYQVTHRVHMAAIEQYSEPSPPERPIPVFDIGPGGIDILGSIPIEASDEVWEGIRNRRLSLYVWGKIEYEDVFGRVPRTTEYRMSLSPMSDDLLPCPEGNKST